MKTDKTLGILFLGGAKRVSIGRLFLRAARERGYDCKIYSYEINGRVPVAEIATVIKGLRWNDPEIYSDLSTTVDSYGIDIIVPFVDGAVGVAAEFAARFPDKVFVPASGRELSELMFDKVAAASFFEARNIAVPATYHPGDPCLRLIAKPRKGSASKGIAAINTLEQLDTYLSQGDNFLIQERIDNREEFSVDCYVDTRDGKILAVSPRKRLEVVGGEASSTITVDNPALTVLARNVLATTGLRGAVTLQFIHDLDNGRMLLMEINPRLGGACVCSVHAGCDIPAMIIDEASGVETVPASPVPGVEIARYMQEVVFYPDNN